jgi:hypothetical protein
MGHGGFGGRGFAMGHGGFGGHGFAMGLIHRNNRSEEAFDSASGHRDGPLR